MSRSNFDPIDYLARASLSRGNRTEPITPNDVSEMAEWFRYMSPDELSDCVRREEAYEPIPQLCFLDLSQEAEFKYWSVYPSWSVEQAVALSLGKVPSSVNWEVIQELAKFSAVASLYLERRELLINSARANIIPNPIPPAAFVMWAMRAGVTVPPDLLTAVRERALELVVSTSRGTHLVDTGGEAKVESPNSHESSGAEIGLVGELRREIAALRDRLTAAESRLVVEKRSLTREKNTILRLFIGLAAAIYKYDPRSSDDRPTTEILNDLADAAVDVHPNTIRKYLGLGGEMFLSPRPTSDSQEQRD
jgi:hypothetical protein